MRGKKAKSSGLRLWPVPKYEEDRRVETWLVFLFIFYFPFPTQAFTLLIASMEHPWICAKTLPAAVSKFGASNTVGFPSLLGF